MNHDIILALIGGALAGCAIVYFILNPGKRDDV